MEMTELFLERLRSPEVRAALEAGYSTVIVPLGAVEQHGPHLPLFVDAERGTRLGLEVARRLGHTLVAPTIRVGCSDHHMSFPGTLSLRPATLEALCTDYCVSLAKHGFRTICMLPTHGGNFAPLMDMLERLREAVGPDTTVLAYTDLMGVFEIWRTVVGERTGWAERVGGHADIAESSEMLAIHPTLVAVDQAAPGFSGDLDEETVHRIIRDGFHTVSPNGIIGDATGLSAELGEACLAACADAAAAAFRLSD